MHSGQTIKQVNHQVPIDLKAFKAGSTAKLVLAGKPVGENILELSVDEVNESKGYLVLAGKKVQAYMGSLISHNGNVGVLEAA